MTDVRMPDGTIIKNVPEGTTQAELLKRLKKSKSPAVDIAAVESASKALTPEIIKLSFNPPRFDREGNELFTELVKEPGESMGELLTRSLQTGQIDVGMIPEEIQGKFATGDPRTGQTPPTAVETALARTGQQQLQNIRGLSALLTGGGEANQAIAAEENRLLSPAAQENPLANLAGTLAGNLIPLPGGPLTQAAIGVGQGAISRKGAGQELTIPGLAADAVLSGGLARLVSPRAPASPIEATTPSGLSRQQSQLLQSRGVTLSPAEAAKGRPTGILERALEPGLDTTPTGQIASAFRTTKQMQEINKNITGFFTTPRKVFNSDTINKVSNELGQEFDEILDGAAIGFERMNDAASRAKVGFVSDPSGIRPSNDVFKIVDGFVQKNPNGITGQEYIRIRSTWLKKWRDWNKTPERSSDAEAMSDLISVMDDAFALTMPEGTMTRYTDLRKRWNMFRLTREATDTSSGRISAPKLLNKINRKNETAVPIEFRDFVEAATNVLRSPLGQSGTAPRISLQMLIQAAAQDPKAAVFALGAHPTLSAINAGTANQALAAAFGRTINPQVEALNSLLPTDDERPSLLNIGRHP